MGLWVLFSNFSLVLYVYYCCFVYTNCGCVYCTVPMQGFFLRYIASVLFLQWKCLESFYALWFSCSQRLSNYLALSVPNEVYTRNMSWTLNLISIFSLLNETIKLLKLELKISLHLQPRILVSIMLPITPCSYIPDIDCFIPGTCGKLPLIIANVTTRNNIYMPPEM